MPKGLVGKPASGSTQQEDQARSSQASDAAAEATNNSSSSSSASQVLEIPQETREGKRNKIADSFDSLLKKKQQTNIEPSAAEDQSDAPSTTVKQPQTPSVNKGKAPGRST